jgi:YVTN family beta-propeller protein
MKTECTMTGPDWLARLWAMGPACRSILATAETVGWNGRRVVRLQHKRPDVTALRARPARACLHCFCGLALALALRGFGAVAEPTATPARIVEPGCLSPGVLVGTKDGKTLFIACATATRVLRFDTASGRVQNSIPVAGSPLGLALSPDEERLFVTCAGTESRVCLVDAATCKVVGLLSAGHTAMAPVLSRDGKTLYVCDRFNDSVGVIDLAAGKEMSRIPVRREPVAAALTRDGKHLLVANHLHNKAADTAYVAAVVSAIDLAQGKVTAEFLLPDGSGELNDIRISPDGKYAAVTHVLAQYRPAAGNLRTRWMNANALTLIDLGRMEVLASTLLDDRGRGAANPWGIAWSADGSTLVVTHAGTHELSVIDFPSLLKKLLELPAPFDPLKARNPAQTRREPTGYSIPFFAGSRRRIKLPAGDFGPRAVTIVGQRAYIANYFSDTLTAVDLTNANAKPESLPLNNSALRTPHSAQDLVRKGEFYFHDGSICFQGWQSCSSCHPGGARADGLNWDLLNDGTGNPKNTKSLLFAHQTPPAMWLGVRETAETAVRAGLKHILLTQQPEEVASAIDAYLKSLKPIPSPNLVHGQLSDAAKRGEKVFSQAGCAECHPPPLFTDLKPCDVGTRREFDGAGGKFDTPNLVEVWRTAPYLHDGSAATMRDVLTACNPHDRHGRTSDLTRQEISDLCAYLLSL